VATNNFVDNTNVRAQKYSERVWREKLPEAFWSKFMDFPMPGDKNFSKDQYIIDRNTGQYRGYRSKDTSPIFVVRDLMSGFGDKITFPHVKALRGEGILGSSGETLKGREEEMTTSNYAIELEEYSHAVSDKSPLGRKRVQFDILREMGNQIMSWGVVKMDKNIWEAFYSGTPTTIIYPGTRSATTQLTDSDEDKLSLKLLRTAKAIARDSNNGARYLIEPYIWEGKEYYFVVGDNDTFLDLINDSEVRQNWQQAGPRDMSNPLFSGAQYITMDGLVIFAHERAKKVTNWGASANVAGSRIKLFGKNAICHALGEPPQLVQENDDYNRKRGLSIQFITKTSRPIFNSVDYGSLEIRVSRTRRTDA